MGDGNIDKIGALFLAAVAEVRGEDGPLKKVINVDVLKQLLSWDQNTTQDLYIDWNNL